MNMNHAWIFHQAALGDFILILPMLRALKEAGWNVQLVSTAAKGRVAEQFIEGLQSHDIEQRHWTMMHAENADESSLLEAKKNLSQAAIVVSFVSDGHDAWAKNCLRIAPEARHFFVLPRAPENWPGHITQWHAQQLAMQGLRLKHADQPGAKMNITGPLIIHPGSGGVKKCWPVDRFEKLISTMQNKGFSVRVVLGEAEMERWPLRLREAWIERYEVSLPRSLDELVALIAAARLYIGNDSGPTHLAAQMGVPTVALFGPTSPQLWSPHGPLVTVLAPEKMCEMNWLDVESVLRVCGVA